MRKRTSAQHVAGIAMVVMAWVACNQSSGGPPFQTPPAATTACANNGSCPGTKTTCQACVHDSDCAYMTLLPLYCLGGVCMIPQGPGGGDCRNTVSCPPPSVCGPAPSYACVCTPPDAGPDANGPDEGIVDGTSPDGTTSTTSNTGSISVNAVTFGTPAQSISSASADFSHNLYVISDITPAVRLHPLDPATGCVFSQYTGNLSATPVAKSAGVVTITGGATSPVTMTPDATNTYSQYFASNASTPALYTGGESITVAAAGADVPAFMTTLVAPSEVTLTAPATPLAQPFVIDRATPLVFTWTGGMFGYVVVQVGDAGTATQAEYVVCTFKATDGTGTVPVHGLMRLAAGTGAFVSVYVQNSNQVVAGAYTNQIVLSTGVLGSDGNPVGSDTATLQ